MVRHRILGMLSTECFIKHLFNVNMPTTFPSVVQRNKNWKLILLFKNIYCYLHRLAYVYCQRSRQLDVHFYCYFKYHCLVYIMGRNNTISDFVAEISLRVLDTSAKIKPGLHREKLMGGQ